MATRDIYATGFDESSGKTIEATSCPECAGELVTEGGEIGCTDCGLIVNEYWIDHGPAHYRFCKDGSNIERTGAPLTPARHDRGLSTEIGFGVDGTGKSLSGSKRRRLGRLRTQHNRARWRSKGERNLAHGLGEIARISGALDIPRPVRDRACTRFREAQRENLFRGRSLEAMVGGSVYAACRSTSCLRTIEEILEVLDCSRSSLLNAYRVLQVELGVEASPTDVRDYVSKFASTCGVSSPVKERALSLAVLAEDEELTNGRKPSGVAAGCLYYAGRELDAGLTQRAMADVAGVSAVTIRDRYYELLEAETDGHRQ